MKHIVKIAFSDDAAPAGALEDALGLAALCLMVLAGFAATSFA